VFISERAGPFTPKGVARMIERAARKAKLEIKAHTHMLRHGAGFALAAQQQTTRGIQAWLGHRSIGNTVIYTALAPDQFSGFWRKGGRP
jgi:site-specific recombinase XerD